MKEYYFENEKKITNQKKVYENYYYLSSNEKKIFDDKFTKPKNGTQRDYHNLLNQRIKKLVFAVGPAGTG